MAKLLCHHLELSAAVMQSRGSGHGKSVCFTKEVIGAGGRSLIISGSLVLRIVSTRTVIQLITRSPLVCFISSLELHIAEGAIG